MAIPLPGPIGDALGQGIDAGFSGVNQLLQPYFNRKMQQAEQQRMAEQFQKELAMRQEQQQRLAQQFQQDFALRQQGEQRRNSLMPLEEQLLQQKINAQRPEYMAQQAQEFMNAFGGPEAMKNPIMKGFLKNKFGIDLDRESPEKKEERALDLFKKKQDIKASTQGGDIPTNKILTQNQQALQAIDTVTPMIKDLIDNPNKIFGPWDVNPSLKASYEAKTGGMIDQLVAAQSLPQVRESVKLVEDQIRRRSGETVSSYTKRLEDFLGDLNARREKALKLVKTRKVDTPGTQDHKKMSTSQSISPSSNKEDDPLGIRQ